MFIIFTFFNQFIKTMEEKIDLVYTWVDGNDLKHKEKRIELAKKLGLLGNEYTNISNNDCRFIDNEELKFSLRSVSKYADWINNIYIITDNQIPNWLNLDNKKIKIIDHKDIIPEEYLPTFNSNCIEFCICNIKELSEKFIYSNDDMFLSNFVKPEDFFYNEKPVYYFEKKISTKIVKYPVFQYFVNSYFLLKKYYNEAFCIDTAHCAVPFNKSVLIECNNRFKKDIEKTTLTHFRNKNNLCMFLYMCYTILTNKGVFKINKRKYKGLLGFFKNNFSKFIKYVEINDIGKLPDILKKYKCSMFCLNDTEDTLEENRKKVKNVLEKLFPEKSQFEI